MTRDPTLPPILRVLPLCLLLGCTSAVTPAPKHEQTQRLTEAPRWSQVHAIPRDDLAMAGLGVAGLRAAAPTIGPDSQGLYQATAHANYRALVDVSEAGGFGRLYGPGEDAHPVPGTEYWALGTRPDGSSHVMLLQVPEAFDAGSACLIAAPASGSRGPLGALGTVGDWALRQSCAVVYTDKGAGPWVANAHDGRGYEITGERAATANLKRPEPFSLNDWPQTDSLAFKHAHSGHNAQAQWGQMVLDSIDFALHRLNSEHRPDGHPAYSSDRILVIAASISNGGGAVLAAAEQDQDDRIDAVVASEPNVQIAGGYRYTLEEGGQRRQVQARSLFDYASLAALYGPCATLSDRHAGAPMADNQQLLKVLLQGRCTALREAGLLEAGGSLPEQAWQKLIDHGLHPDASDAQVLNTLINSWALIASVYASSYGQLDPTDALCGIQYRAFNASAAVTTVDPNGLDTLFATSAGLPPAAGIDLAVEDAEGRIGKLILATSDTGQPNYGLEPMRCLRQQLHLDTPMARRIQAGIEAVSVRAQTGKRPVMILHGQSDALIWINHASRAYVHAHQSRASHPGTLSYIEVSNAQHFDGVLAIPSMAERFVPLHYYMEAALERMLEHLRSGRPLPPSQLIRTTPRGRAEDGSIPPLDHLHVPLFVDEPGQQALQIADGLLRIPQ